MENMVYDLLKEINELKDEIKRMHQWMDIQITSYKNQNEKLSCEVRTLLIQTNIIVSKIKQDKKQTLLKFNKLC